jgi:hypothetical protein
MIQPLFFLPQNSQTIPPPAARSSSLLLLHIKAPKTHKAPKTPPKKNQTQITCSCLHIHKTKKKKKTKKPTTSQIFNKITITTEITTACITFSKQSPSQQNLQQNS